MPEYTLPGIHTLIFILLHRNHPSLPASQALVMPAFFPERHSFSRCAGLIFRIY
ncbi:hypothetical protein H217_2258 [Klebsiella pneumoniae DMC0799]|jgi:hypothetical protein|nr:hypothetical protein HMPREF9538_04855 [Klebsiella sp. MS 92-3]EOY62566.1 hypothetical protein H253_1946 [Klebsiella pneumoniae KP-7]EOZ63540.1 hypothetical protein H254_1811 [Klebsiella pneumoniae KP-11]EPO21349.1 hypothetical protein H217_2258 [Klebsiella pneumoniae DMC0799]